MNFTGKFIFKEYTNIIIITSHFSNYIIIFSIAYSIFKYMHSLLIK
jgi:hypothetical protein